MRLTSDAFETLSDALADAFSERGEFQTLARCIETRLGDIVNPAGRVPDLVQALIECAEKADCVGRLVECAKRDAPTNRLVTALDATRLEEAAVPRDVVEAGEGARDFKRRLVDALDQFEQPGMQAVARRDVGDLLESASRDEAETVFLALLGTLKTDRPDEVLRELTPLLSDAFRRSVGDGARPESVSVDFARTRLRRVDLSDLDLHGADFAFADLAHADLTNVNLWRSRAYGVNVEKAGLSRSNLEEVRWHEAAASEARFHDCRMVSAFFKDAVLTGAQFQRSRLQGAHFEGADLRGARFEQANVADASLVGAVVDEAAAASLSRAVNWRKARFDHETLEIVRRQCNGTLPPAAGSQPNAGTPPSP